MSIVHDEQQQAIARESRRVIDARMDKARLLALLERTGEYDRPFWDTAVEQGWTALAVPEAQGGLGLGLIELGLVAQATGAATAGAPFLTSSYGVIRALLGSEHAEAQRKWLPLLASGEAVGAVAFAEDTQPLPGAPQALLRDGRLSGEKPGVTAGTRADIAVVWACHGDRQALALVELDGAARHAVDSFDNSRLFADLSFADARATLLGEGEAARTAALDVLAGMAVVTAHEQVGGAEALLLAARDYALERRAFGQPIGAFQSVKHRIAELYGLVEIARANCIHSAASDGRPDFIEAAAAARFSATEAYDTAVRDCVQIHGGLGVTWEGALHLHMRRARSLAIEQGNMLFWEDLLAERLSGQMAGAPA
jgi:acyl-CoA dehydrogenase